jgi:hypothetical protein
MEEEHEAAMLLLAQAVAKAEVVGEKASPSEPIQHLTAVDNEQIGAETPYIGSNDTYQRSIRFHTGQISATDETPPNLPLASRRHEKRPAQRRMGHQVAAAAPFPHLCDEMVHLHATIGEHGTTVSISTRRRADQQTLADGNSGSVAV